jgi:hypothetical protein
METSVRKIITLILLLIPSITLASDEIALFSGNGEAVAYIALNDVLTIYIWSGKPAAYLSEDNAGGYHVYGFNGKHLGWFVSNELRDHKGDAACGTKETMNSTKFEAFKAFKQFKPFKAFKEFAPYRPSFSNNFGQIPCKLLIASGSAG